VREFPDSPDVNVSSPAPSVGWSQRGATTGHPGVDAVLAAIANAADLPAADQIAQYEAAHRTLRDILATIDQA
jgi:hypothetical protein